jgi:hypothetical protein
MLATGDCPNTNTHADTTTASFDDWFNEQNNMTEACDPGQHFHVDFGFMKGSGYCKKDEEGRTITKITVVHKAGYIMDPTAPKAAVQNGKAERPNRNLGKTVRCLLYNTNLGPEYWSFALLHAVYLKNLLPHCATNQVPITAYSGKCPNAKRLRIFGCPIVIRHMDRKVKLDLNTSAGIFLGYTTTDKNVVYRDNVTGRFKTATHVVLDETGMTLPAAERSPAAKVLQELGYGKTQETAQEETPHEDISNMQDEESPNPINPLPSQQPATANTLSDTCNHLQVKLLSIHASLPVRATDGSAGYDVFSSVDTIIQPKTRKAISLDIAITPPPGCYSQIFSRSGLSLKHQVDV